MMKASFGERSDVINVVLDEPSRLIPLIPLPVDILDLRFFLLVQIWRLLKESLLSSLQVNSRFMPVGFVHCLRRRASQAFQAKCGPFQ